MSKDRKIKHTESVTVVVSHRRANIAVAIVGGITALVLITIAVLCAVRVDPLDGLKEPVRYELYDIGTEVTEPLSTNDAYASKLRNAVGDMDFSIMNAILQWNWDYSYNFTDGNKMTAAEIDALSSTEDKYMVEYIYAPVTITDGEIDYATAQSLKVDGETIYFDRVKVLIGNTSDSVGEINLYPYIYDRVKNQAANDGITYEEYSVKPIKVRANTTSAYAALGALAREIANG